MRHMDLRVLFVKDLVREGIICLARTPSGSNVADMSTKPVDAETLKRCVQNLDGLKIQHRAQSGSEVNMVESEQLEVYSEVPQQQDTVWDTVLKVLHAVVLMLGVQRIITWLMRRGERSGKTYRDAAVQSMTTYTAVRGSHHPRFQPLPEMQSGVFRE